MIINILIIVILMVILSGGISGIKVYAKNIGQIFKHLWEIVVYAYKKTIKEKKKIDKTHIIDILSLTKPNFINIKNQFIKDLKRFGDFLFDVFKQIKIMITKNGK